MKVFVLILCFSIFISAKGQGGDLPSPSLAAEIESSAGSSDDRSILPPKILPPLIVKFPMLIPVGLINSLIRPSSVVVTQTQATTPTVTVVLPTATPVQPTNPVVVLPPAPVVPVAPVAPVAPVVPIPTPILPPIQTPQPPPVVQSCGRLNNVDPCFQFSTGCYCMVQTPMAWRNALDYCKANGKNLISFDTPAKITNLQENLPLVVGINTPLATAGFWTSGTYVLVVNQYLWASIGQYFTVTNWAAGSPVAATQAANVGGTCVQVGPNSFATNLRWTENTCTNPLPFICQ